MSVAQWTNFLSHSLAARLEPEVFKSYTELLAVKYQLLPLQITEIFLAPTETNDACLDPRIPRYLQVLSELQMVSVPAILVSLRRYSTFGTQAEKENGEAKDADKQKAGLQRWVNSYAMDELLLYKMTKYVSSGNSPKDATEAAHLLAASLHWMKLVTAAGHGTQEILNLEGNKHVDEMNATIMALGTLVVAVVENAQVIKFLGKETSRGIGKNLFATLAKFVPLIFQSSPQSFGRLELFRTQTLVAILPAEKKENEITASKEIDEMLEVGGGIELDLDSMAVADLPIMNSRAGLYIYLNSLLVGRPLIEDGAIFGYLHNRYQGDLRSTAIDLILASFDVLANATFRKEKKDSISIIRSFLINKIPLLLATLSASFFPPLTSEYCISEALSLVDTNVFPTLADANAMFADSVRQDFCFACCLHGLLEESSIETLLGDIPMQSLPAGGRYQKDDLVQQCLSDPEKADGLIDELEHTDGNVGAVSQAITEVIGRLCSNKETMSLKTLSSKLARKPISLDIMLLFDKPITILQPICDLLDNWHYDEDQVEYQPVYEEFGSILLLVLSFVHRYNLSPVDMGIRSPSSFMSKLLNQGHLSRALESLSEQEQNYLDGWIRGLFDNESGGLGDELMSSCPPQDFYLLVPTLFHHIVLACSTDNLSEEGLKCGLEYLGDTFLLPSLISGITWLSYHLWESRGDANAVLHILSALITNSANISNPEASQMLNSILNIIAKSLEHSLRWLQRAEPQRQDVEPLSKALRDNLAWERRGASDHTELETWTSTVGGGLVLAIRNTVGGLVQWGLNPGININPANYTHRQILVGLKILGAKRLLQTIIEEVKSHTELGNGSAVIDVATALICAPEAAAWDGNIVSAAEILTQGPIQPLQRRLTLRETLKIETEGAPKLHKTDAFHAETLVRLQRRVEAQLAVQQPVMMAHDGMGGLTSGLHEELSANIDAALSGGGMNQLGDGHPGIDDDLMSGFVGGGNLGGDDLLDGFGDGGLGDGMGF